MGLTAFDQSTRSTGIGASEAWRIVLGEGALAVYERLVENGPPLTPTLAMREGTYLEPLIAELYAERTGTTLRGPMPTERHHALPFLLATLDRVRERDGLPVEIKRPKWRSREQWGDEGSDRVPMKYRVQCVVQMSVCERDAEDLVAYIEGEDDIRVYPIARDPELEGMVLDRIASWWSQHVEQRIPPRPDGTDETAGVLHRRFPRDRLPLLDPDEESETLAYELAKLRSSGRENEKREKEIENLLKEKCGAAAGIKGLFTWKIEGDGEGRVAWKALCEEMSPTAEQIAKFRTTPRRTFRLSRKLEG